MLELISKEYINALQQERIHDPNGRVATIIKESNADLFIRLIDADADFLFDKYAFLLKEEPDFRANETMIKTYIKEFPYRQVFLALDQNKKALIDTEISLFIQRFQTENIETGRYLLTRDMLEYINNERLNFISAQTVTEQANSDIRLILENQERQRIERYFGRNQEGVYIPIQNPTLIEQEISQESPLNALPVESLEKIDDNTEVRVRINNDIDRAKLKNHSASRNEPDKQITTDQQINTPENQQPKNPNFKNSQEISMMVKQEQMLEAERQRLRLLTQYKLEQEKSDNERQVVAGKSNLTNQILKKGLGAAIAGSTLTIGGVTFATIFKLI